MLMQYSYLDDLQAEFVVVGVAYLDDLKTEFVVIRVASLIKSKLLGFLPVNV